MIKNYKIFKFFLLISLIIYGHNSHAQNFSKTPKILEIIINQGDTLSDILENIGLSKIDSYHISHEISDIFPLNKLKTGQKLIVNTVENNNLEDNIELVSLLIDVDSRRKILLKKLPGNIYSAQEEKVKVVLSNKVIGGKIDGSLYGGAAKLAIADTVIMQMIKLLSYDIDLQRDLRQNDEFAVIYEEFHDSDNNLIDYGNIIFASVKTNSKNLNIYRYKIDDKNYDYFDQEGRSIKKSLLRTPIDGARITSGFGKRRHPILGYNKLHKGLDFGAPSGTPIYAAGDGVITYLGRNGGYGNYIKIKHKQPGYSTAYAHMKNFNPKLRKSSHVKQGQIIGYVGTTGRSTGPHLHYEVLKNNRHIDPLSVKGFAVTKLTGSKLADFKQYKYSIDSLLAAKLVSKKTLAVDDTTRVNKAGEL